MPFIDNKDKSYKLLKILGDFCGKSVNELKDFVTCEV